MYYLLQSNHQNKKIFVQSLLDEFRYIPKFVLIIFDSLNELNLDKKQYPNYYNTNLESNLDSIIGYVEKLKNEASTINGIIMIYGFQKFLNNLSSSEKLVKLANILKAYEKVSLIIVDDANKLKTISDETWFNSVFTTTDGIWIGNLIGDVRSVFNY